MKLLRTAFPDGTIIDHKGQDINVGELVDQYRWDKAVEKRKQLEKEVKQAVNETKR